MKECIVILGMHRSGTSVLTGLISLFGGYIGADAMSATEANPMGYFENNKVYTLNEKILKAHQTSWDTVSFSAQRIQPEHFRALVAEARQVIDSEFRYVNTLLIKDPRMCLLFPIWEQALQEMNIRVKPVLVYRSPLEVAFSLQHRDELDIERGLLVWAHYLFSSESFSRQYPERLVIEYDKDFRQLTTLLETLSQFLGVEVTDSIAERAVQMYSPSLKHHTIELGNISGDLPAYLKDLIALLLQSGLNSTEKLDSLAADFYTTSRFYRHNTTRYRALKKEQQALQVSLQSMQAQLAEKEAALEACKNKKKAVEKQRDLRDKKLQTYEQALKQEKRKQQAMQQSLQARLRSREKEYQSNREALESIIRKNKTDYLLSRSSIESVMSSKQQMIATIEATLERKSQDLVKQAQRYQTAEAVFYRVLREPHWCRKLKRIQPENTHYKNKQRLLPLARQATRQYLKDKAVIVESGLFSSFYYLTHYPDVFQAGVDPVNHYCQYGWKEGRNPSPYFNTRRYLTQYRDVEKAGMNPLLHYLRYGKGEGRSPCGEEIPPERQTAWLSGAKKESQAGSGQTLPVPDTACQRLKQVVQQQALPVLQRDNNAILVSIIVLNRDGAGHLKTLIPALYEHTQGIRYELIVVDNASTDNSVSYLENSTYDMPLKLIRNSVNETFSRGNNQGARQARGKYLVLLNNDVEPLPGWLHHLLHCAEKQEKTGAVGSRLVYPFKASFENSCSVQHAGIAFRDEVGFFRPYNQGNGRSGSSPHVMNNGRKAAVTAACLLVPKAVYQQVGGLDEGYNYGFEDVDFGLKLIQAGYHNYYCAESVLFHYEFGTQEKNDREEVKQRRLKNTERFRYKWFSVIKGNYWKEKLFNGSSLYAETPLKVALAITDYGPNVAAGDYFTAQELATALEVLGWSVTYLSRVKQEWYQIGEEVDVLISLIDAYDLNKIPKRNKRLYRIAWARNWFDRWCNNPSFEHYDQVFASSHLACDYIRQHSRQEAMLLPIASNPERFARASGCKNAQQYQSDICFTGNYWSSPRDIMEALSEQTLKKYRFHVYGANWEKFKKFKPYHKGFLAYGEIPCVYQQTRIVIDDANHITKPYGSVNSRVFDALMSGALVITNGVEGSKDLFQGELPYYETPRQLDQLLDFYLGNEAARQQKIGQLRRIILGKHTYHHRAKAIRQALMKRFIARSIAIKIPAPNWQGAHSWGDYHIAVLLKQQLEKLGYSVLLQVLPEWDNEAGMACDIALVLRGLSRYNVKPHQLNLMWNISHPDAVTLEEYEEYDQVFIASTCWAEHIAGQVSVPVSSLLQCTDPERFRRPDARQRKAYRKSLLFVGNSRNVFRKVLNDLLPTHLDLSVYGRNWNKLIPLRYIKGEHIPNDELYRYYGSADILLNDHWDDMREQGFVSNRLFDGLACGAFIVTDQVKAMGELKQFVQTYETADELQELIQYYLEHPEERRKKARQGMEYVRQQHTFKQRAEAISRVIEQLLSCRQTRLC